jgi:DNA polymerase III sliding clamp (beta) subunit (PCNA family)
MKVDRRALHSALSELAQVADLSASLPILSHVLLRAASGQLVVTATDLTRRLVCQLPTEGEDKPHRGVSI